ncbi:MAG: hypothetical protein OHK0013_50140 [Sandaracinaceae bacterium]
MRYRPTVMRPLHVSVFYALVAVLAVGCGGARPASESNDATTRTETSSTGGEVEAPRTLYTTIPVPVPQPAVPRDTLGAPVQATWLEVEQAIAVRPPEPPSSEDENSLRAWYTDAFTPWLRGRVEASQRAEAHANELEGAPAHERGVVAGLLGYFHEQTAAEARGAPIPASIARDEELLDIYSRSLDQALAPLALRSAEAYRFCIAAFEELGDALGPWSEWRAWCADRGEEVVRVYTQRARQRAEPTNEGASP